MVCLSRRLVPGRKPGGNEPCEAAAYAASAALQPQDSA